MLVHVTDWYPTLLSAAGADIGYHRSTKLHNTDSMDVRFVDNAVMNDIPLDGKDLWDVIQFGTVSNDEISYDEREILLDLNTELNCTFSACGAIRKGDWKYIRGANMLRHIPEVHFQISRDSEWQRYVRFGVTCCWFCAFTLLGMFLWTFSQNLENDGDLSVS